MTDRNDEVDALLKTARDGSTQVPDHLMARVLSDAAAVQSEALAARRVPDSPDGIWLQIRNLLGGWQALGGLAAASCAGFWIGINPPQDLFDPASLLFDDAYYSEFDETTNLAVFGWVLEEG